MAENDEFDGNEDETPKDLRKQIEKANKTIKELEGELEKHTAKDRTRTISDYLSGKDLSPKVAGFVPASIATDDASLDAWLTEYGDVFGAPKAAEASDAEGEVDDETKAAHERVAAATAGAPPATKLTDIEARIKAATTKEELDAVLASAR